MKTVLLMRHAEAAPESAGQTDYDRPLTEDGIRIATQTGKALKAAGVTIDRIVASAAVRTTETARLVASKASPECPVILLEGLYSAPAELFAQVPRQYGFEDEQTLLIVGHNPGIGQLICYFAKDLLSVPPATLAGFQFDVAAWEEISRETATLARLIRNGQTEIG
ncbi:MAG: histidine phosphatase family protein [Planctomycetaceae bacterium]|nr:histidine phosphatase family protein [Planctomycetaceae bacterium]